jgi:hypothetical protein
VGLIQTATVAAEETESLPQQVLLLKYL